MKYLTIVGLILLSGCADTAGSGLGGTSSVAWPADNSCGQWVLVDNNQFCQRWVQPCVFGGLKCLYGWDCGNRYVLGCQ